MWLLVVGCAQGSGIFEIGPHPPSTPPNQPSKAHVADRSKMAFTVNEANIIIDDIAITQDGIIPLLKTGKAWEKQGVCSMTST